jgi:hypothetical protein
VISVCQALQDLWVRADRALLFTFGPRACRGELLSKGVCAADLRMVGERLEPVVGFERFGFFLGRPIARSRSNA